MKILVIEDDFFLRKIIQKNLEEIGYEVFCAENGLKGVKLLESKNIDLLLLDKRLPDIDGINICKGICKEKLYGDVAVIMISGAKSQNLEENVLMAGAIDYIEKPIDIRKLKFKIRNMKDFINSKRKYTKRINLIEYKDIKFDMNINRVQSGEKEISLTPKEYGILAYILTNKGDLVTKKDLIENIWGETNLELNEVTLHSHISRLKNKINTIKENLKTVYGKGYRLK